MTTFLTRANGGSSSGASSWTSTTASSGSAPVSMFGGTVSTALVRSVVAGPRDDGPHLPGVVAVATGTAPHDAITAIEGDVAP